MYAIQSSPPEAALMMSMYRPLLFKKISFAQSIAKFVPAVKKHVFVEEFGESPNLMIQFTDYAWRQLPTTSTALISNEAPKSTFKKQLVVPQLLPLKYVSLARCSVPVAGATALVIEKLRAFAKERLDPSLLLIMNVVSAKGLYS